MPRTTYFLLMDKNDFHPTTLNGVLQNQIFVNERFHGESKESGDGKKIYKRFTKEQIRKMDKNIFKNTTIYTANDQGFCLVAPEKCG